MSFIKDLDVAGMEIQLQLANKRNAQLEKEKEKLLQIIKDNDLSEELDFEISVTDEEYICVAEIRKLRGACEIRPLDKNEVVNLDVLFKILKTIRTGKDPADAGNKKQKKVAVAELLKIVDNG